MTQARYQGGYQMTSIGKYKIKDIQKKNPLFSAIRATVETAFYANNVEKIETVA